MQLLRSCVVAAVALAVAQLAAPAAAVGCTGGGDERWCTRGEKGATAAHKIDYCPKVCREKTCDDVEPAEGERRGIYLDFGDDDDNMGRGKNWEEIARSGKYEHVFADNDKYVCLTTCWYQPWRAKCEKWEEVLGRKYCVHINCEHDKYGKAGGNRFAGCHEDEDGDLKLDWHKPTCNECIQLFPACYDELKSFADRDDDRAVEAINDAIETEAQEYCFNNYFQEFGGTFIADSSEADSSEADSSEADPSEADSSQADSSEADPSEADSSQADSSQAQPKSASGSGRRLMSSGDDDSEGFRDGLNGPSWSRQVANYARETVRDMIDDGKLTCPAAQCLTNDLQLFLSYAGVSKPTPTPTPTFTGPWYHTITEGFCAWKCELPPLADLWCSRSVENCMICKSTWCPPDESLPWDPVTLDTYEPKPEWYEATTEGFCAWNTNCNANYPVQNLWCGRKLGNCHGCRGTWCPPPAMSGTWEPVPPPMVRLLPGAEGMPISMEASAMAPGLAETEEMPIATETPDMGTTPAEMEQMPVTMVESAMAPGPAESEEMPMATADPAMAPGPAEMQKLTLASVESAMAPGPAEMEKMPMATAEPAMAPGPAEMEEMYLISVESAMAPGPAEMEEMPMASVESAMAPGPAEMLIEMEDMEMMAEAPGPAGMGRRMLSTGGNAASGGGGYMQALNTFADKSQCPSRIVNTGVKMKDFLD